MKSKIAIIILAMASVSCSTTRILGEDEVRHRGNKVEISDSYGINPNELEKYIKQNGNIAWSPMMCVYNWQNGKGKGWDRFVKKIGVPPVVFDRAVVESSAESICDHLEYLGYYDSKVNTSVSIKNKKATVTYTAIPGHRITIKEIRMSVPEGQFSEAFYADTANMLVRKGMPLSEFILEKETERGSKVFRNQGFYTFNKNHYFFLADTLEVKDSAILDLSVREYTRNENPTDAKPLKVFRYNKVSISYPSGLPFKEDIIKNLNTIKPGNVYGEEDVANTYARLAALKVFSGVNVSTTQVSDDLVDCTINMNQSKIQGFKVNLEASTNSTGLIGISPQVSYLNKNIFHGAEWLNLSFMGNFQFKPREDTHSNEFGVSAGLSFPRAVFFPYAKFKANVPRTDVSLSYNYQNRPEYTRNILSASAGYSGSLGKRLFYQAYPLKFNLVNLQNLDPLFYLSLQNDPFLRDAYQDHFDLGSGGLLYYTTNSDAIPKTSYFYSKLQLDLAGNILSAFKGLMKHDENGAGIILGTPYSQYIRYELSVGKTWRLGKKDKQSIATRFLSGTGWAYGNSSALPFEKHFYAGGANSMRGWQTRTLGPGSSPIDESFVIPSQTGDMKLEANVEWRFPITWKLEGALFYDVGNIWTIRDSEVKDSKFSFNNLWESHASDWGYGIRLNLNFLLLRVDMGLKVHDPARENKWVSPSGWYAKDGYAIHFGVGYPF